MSVVKEKKGAAEKSAGGSFFQNLLVWGIYKRNQGRITRQVTFFAILIGLALGAWRLNEVCLPREGVIEVMKRVARRDWHLPENVSLRDVLMGGALPAVMLLFGSWIAYRLVNMPSFADFLIAVEAEMGKVSWPTQTELMRGTTVVLLTIFILTTVLFSFDFIWHYVFINLLHI